MFLGAVLIGFGTTELFMCRSAAMATAAVIVAAIGLVIVATIGRRLGAWFELDEEGEGWRLTRGRGKTVVEELWFPAKDLQLANIEQKKRSGAHLELVLGSRGRVVIGSDELHLPRATLDALWSRLQRSMTSPPRAHIGS